MPAKRAHRPAASGLCAIPCALTAMMVASCAQDAELEMTETKYGDQDAEIQMNEAEPSVQEAKLEEFKKKDTIAGFFKTPPGTMAFLPGVVIKTGAKSASKFNVLGKDGAYQIPTQGKCWFIVNHRDMDNPAGNATYLGVQMVLFHDTDWGEKLTITRNEGWARSEENIEGIKKDEKFKKVLNRDIGEFLKLHKQDDLSSLDQFLGTMWHATPIASNRFSWEKRGNWGQHEFDYFSSQKFRSSFVPPVPEGKEMSFQSYLIKFETTHKEASRRRVIFYFNCMNSDFVWLKTFVPDTNDFLHEYYLSIKR